VRLPGPFVILYHFAPGRAPPPVKNPPGLDLSVTGFPPHREEQVKMQKSKVKSENQGTDRNDRGKHSWVPRFDFDF
jgi:hypothetical protein